MATITNHVEETLDERTSSFPPQGPRVRWAGVMGGFFVALGVLMIMGALGLAVGVTGLGDPRAATGETASGLGFGAGVWAFITMLVALFLGGMVSTKVTDRPDRPGALIHGVLVWVLFSLFTVWMIASGVSLGLSGLFGALSGLTRGATTAVAAGGGDLVQTLGLNDPNQVMNKLDDPGGLHPGGGHRDVDGRGEGGLRGPADSRASGPRRPCPGRRRGPPVPGPV